MDVFSPDAEHFQPKQIVKSLLPSWNKLVFFEVSPVSFHQVNTVRQIYKHEGSGILLSDHPPSKYVSHQVAFIPTFMDSQVNVLQIVSSLFTLCVDMLLVLLLQVSEVLSEETSRLSISGWFHGPSLTRPPTYFEPPIPRNPHIPQDVSINYLDSYLTY